MPTKRNIEKRIEEQEDEIGDGAEVNEEELQAMAEIISDLFDGKLSEDEFEERWEREVKPFGKEIA